jgi:hypothetical protein
MNVKRPYLFLIIFFTLGYLGSAYGLSVLADWIIFSFGVVGLYQLIKFHY